MRWPRWLDQGRGLLMALSRDAERRAVAQARTFQRPTGVDGGRALPSANPGAKAVEIGLDKVAVSRGRGELQGAKAPAECLLRRVYGIHTR